MFYHFTVGFVYDLLLTSEKHLSLPATKKTLSLSDDDLKLDKKLMKKLMCYACAKYRSPRLKWDETEEMTLLLQNHRVERTSRVT